MAAQRLTSRSPLIQDQGQDSGDGRCFLASYRASSAIGASRRPDASAAVPAVGPLAGGPAGAGGDSRPGDDRPRGEHADGPGAYTDFGGRSGDRADPPGGPGDGRGAPRADPG